MERVILGRESRLRGLMRDVKTNSTTEKYGEYVANEIIINKAKMKKRMDCFCRLFMLHLSKSIAIR